MAPPPTTANQTEKIAAALNRGLEQKAVESYAPVAPERLTPEQARAWEHDGYFIVRKLVPDEECRLIDDAVIEMVRRMEATGWALERSRVQGGSFTVPEENFSHEVEMPEDRISKVYNLHREDVFRALARREDLTGLIGGLVGPDIDIFNSQYIFKNPGAWGQPWHQDSLYFKFNRFPQVGMWLATSPATIENGCLFVMPGSHREPVHEHLADSRPEANLGYLEIRDYDFSAEVPVLMEPGDVLLFHSFLMHRSADNTGKDRRTAVVYHYGASGTKAKGIPSPTVDWMPALRGGVGVPTGPRQPWRQWRPRLQLAIGVALLQVVRAFRRGKEKR